MKDLSILYKKDGLELKAFLKGSLVSLAAIDLKNILFNKVNSVEERLVVDLTKVTEVDTTGINTLFQTQLHCQLHNTDLILMCQEHHPIKNLLKLTHATSQFDIELA